MTESISRSSLEFAVQQTQTDGYLNVVTLGVPESESLAFGRNTRLPSIALRDVELKNSVYMYYDRQDIAVVFAVYEDNQELPLDGVVNTHQLIPQINAKYHVALLPEDIVLEPLNSGNITITVTPTSLAWYGTYNFTVTVPLPVEAQETVTETTASVIDNEAVVAQDITRFVWPFVLRTLDGVLLMDTSSNFLTSR